MSVVELFTYTGAQVRVLPASGMAGQSWARPGMAVRARLGVAGPGSARHGSRGAAWLGWARRGVAVGAWRGMARHGSARHGTAWQSGQGEPRLGGARHGMAWQSRLGRAWRALGAARQRPRALSPQKLRPDGRTPGRKVKNTHNNHEREYGNDNR